MNYKLLYKPILVCILLCFPFVVSASEPIDAGLITQDSKGNTITVTGLSSLGGPTRSGLGEIDGRSYPPSNLTSQDYTAIYAQANALLREGQEFRLCRLQVQTGDYPCPNLDGLTTDELKLKSYYDDFNDGPLLNDHIEKRERLMEARRLFTSLYLVRNEAQTFEVGEETLLIKEQGLQGMIEVTRELAYAHMIFGSEYAIDAFDYAFTIRGQAGSEACRARYYEENKLTGRWNPKADFFTDQYFQDAECIIEHEIQLLQEALDQYKMAMDIMVSAYHNDLSWPKSVIIGELFDATEVQIFAAAIENYAAVVDEIAIRYRQLGAEEGAISLYRETYDDLFVSTLPLLEKASEIYYKKSTDEDTQTLLDSSGLAVRSALALMRNRPDEIEHGVNVLGFTEDYVPLQSFRHMQAAAKDLYVWLAEDTQNALNASREFDINKGLIAGEMSKVRTVYARELNDLCGSKENNEDFVQCIGSEGSLMERSWLNLASASLQMNLARTRIDALVQKVEDVEARTEQEIRVGKDAVNSITAAIAAQGMARAYQTIESTTTAESDEIFSQKTKTKRKVHTPGFLSGLIGSDESSADVAKYGAIAAEGVAKGVDAFLPGAGKVIKDAFGGAFGDVEKSVVFEDTFGTRHSETVTTAVAESFNPSEIEIAEWENVKAMAQWTKEVEIFGIKRDFEIRDLLRQIALLQIEKQQAAVRYNQAVSEHRGLRIKWQYLSALYHRAHKDLKANYLANPAYRLLKDHKTELAQYKLSYAAKQAYLAAKALEYHIADEIPENEFEKIFLVRHPDHIRAYLEVLDRYDSIGENVEETPVEFSLRVFASGITEQDVANASDTERSALVDARKSSFLAYLDSHLIVDEDGEPDKLVLIFDTDLDSLQFNEQGRFNWRISGAKTGQTDEEIKKRCPVRNSNGVSVEISAGPQTLPSTMAVNLTMSGYASIRNALTKIVEVSPQLATLLPDEKLPQSFRNTLAEATARATIDVNNSDNRINKFCNMSISNSAWIMEVPLKDNQIDYRLFEDIRIKMHTFYY